MELEGHLREAAAAGTTFNADRIAAGGNIDLSLLAAVVDTAPTGTYGAVTVTDTKTPANSGSFFNHYKPDATHLDTTTNQQVVTKTVFDRGVYSAEGTTAVASTWDIRDGASNGLAGLIAGGNITIAAADSDVDATRVNVLANTDVLGTGHIDATTNGNLTLLETAGDFRIGMIQSTAGDEHTSEPQSPYVISYAVF